MESKRFEDGFRVLQGKREFVTYPEDSSFRLWYSDIPWRYDYHLHTAVEIVLTLEGCVDYMVDSQVYRVEKDQILIVPPDISHSLNMEQNSSRLLFLFEPEALMSMPDFKRLSSHFKRVFYLRDESETHVQVRELLLKAADFYRDQPLFWNTACYSCMLGVFAILGNRYLRVSRPSFARKEPNTDTEAMTTAIAYINSHFHEDLSLDQVADFVGFSRYYFSRSFKKRMGYSYSEYLVQKRLQAAVDLLIRTDLPIHEVADQSGFGSVASFNRVFRESKNCTPTQYRALYGSY